MDLLIAKAITIFPMLGAIGAKCDLPGGGSFFGLPHWWKYLNGQENASGACGVAFNFPDDIWAVALALIDILVRIAGIAVVLFIIYAGISYITSQGTPEKVSAARKRITNSLIGLAIILLASVLVAFIGNKVGG